MGSGHRSACGPTTTRCDIDMELCTTRTPINDPLFPAENLLVHEPFAREGASVVRNLGFFRDVKSLVNRIRVVFCFLYGRLPVDNTDGSRSRTTFSTVQIRTAQRCRERSGLGSRR